MNSQNAYNIDDLLVSASHEIMVNGMESNIIPDTIKDWMAGKVLRALPKRLTQKLLSFLLDNRDMEGTLGFRENQNSETPEFTLLIYRTAKSKIRKESESRSNLLNVNQEPINSTQDSSIFNEKTVENNGIEFFGNDIIMDPTSNYCTIPEHSRYSERFDSNAKSTRYSRTQIDQSRLRADSFSESENNSDPEKIKPKKRKRNARPSKKKPIDTETDKLIDTGTKNDINPENTEIYDHYYKPKKSADGTKVFCQQCGKQYSNNGDIRRHHKTQHLDWWSKRPTEKVVRKKRSDFKDVTKNYPDIFYDPETEKFVCLLCDKRSNYSQHAVRHYESVHKKVKSHACHVCGQQFAYGHSLKRHMFIHTGMPSSCEDCGKQFATEYKLREEHIKKHHPLRYQQIRMAMDFAKISEDQMNALNVDKSLNGGMT